MASLHKLSILLTLISSFFLIIYSQSINAQDDDLITRFCARESSQHGCNSYFRSNKQVAAAAATNNTFDLALAIIKNLIIPQAITTHNYLLVKKQANPEIYGLCEAEWAKVVSNFERILEVTAKNKGYKDENDPDFTVESKYINKCGLDLLNKNIFDSECDEGEGKIQQAIVKADSLLAGVYGKR